jgi:hypothetical protein
MNNFIEGDVVICTTTQAGTIIGMMGKNVWVLLRNGDIFTGLFHEIRYPQDQVDLDSCPLDVERLEKKRSSRISE